MISRSSSKEARPLQKRRQRCHQQAPKLAHKCLKATTSKTETGIEIKDKVITDQTREVAGIIERSISEKNTVMVLRKTTSNSVRMWKRVSMSLKERLRSLNKSLEGWSSRLARMLPTLRWCDSWKCRCTSSRARPTRWRLLWMILWTKWQVCRISALPKSSQVTSIKLEVSSKDLHRAKFLCNIWETFSTTSSIWSETRTRTKESSGFPRRSETKFSQENLTICFRAMSLTQEIRKSI